MANVRLEIVLGVFFLILSDADVDFLERELWWRTYTIKKALSTTRRIKLIGRKKFVAAALNLEYETYIVHVRLVSSVTSPSSPLLDIHLLSRPQIFGVITEETSMKVSAKYSDFVDVFSLDLASKLFKHTGINNHVIELVDGQQSPYGPIYSPRPVQLETLKAYIETNLANGLIRLSKSPTGTPILFDWKLDDFF